MLKKFVYLNREYFQHNQALYEQTLNLLLSVSSEALMIMNKNIEDSQSKSNHDGKTLKEILKNRSDIVNRELAKFLGKKSNSSVTQYYKSPIIEDERLYFICKFLGVKPDVFGRPQDYFYKREAEYLHGPANFELITLGRDQAFSEFYKRYFSRLISLLANMRNEYIVVDSLNKHKGVSRSGIQKSKEFEALDRKYFETLQNKIGSRLKTGFKYVRATQIPFEDIYSNHGINNSRALEIAIKTSLPSWFEHICLAFRDFGEIFQFYIIPPIRAFNYYIIDREIIVSEYDSFVTNGLPQLDLIFINQKSTSPQFNNGTDSLIEHHLSDLQDILPKEHRISGIDFKRSFYNLVNDISTQRKQLEVCKSKTGRDLKKSVVSFFPEERIPSEEKDIKLWLQSRIISLDDQINEFHINEKTRIISNIL